MNFVPCYVEYHSPQWEVLVETGWITLTVEGTTAKMVRPHR